MRMVSLLEIFDHALAGSVTECDHFIIFLARQHRHITGKLSVNIGEQSELGEDRNCFDHRGIDFSLRTDAFISSEEQFTNIFTVICKSYRHAPADRVPTGGIVFVKRQPTGLIPFPTAMNIAQTAYLIFHIYFAIVCVSVKIDRIGDPVGNPCAAVLALGMRTQPIIADGFPREIGTAFGYEILYYPKLRMAL